MPYSSVAALVWCRGVQLCIPIRVWWMASASGGCVCGGLGLVWCMQRESSRAFIIFWAGTAGGRVGGCHLSILDGEVREEVVFSPSWNPYELVWLYHTAQYSTAQYNTNTCPTTSLSPNSHPTNLTSFHRSLPHSPTSRPKLPSLTRRIYFKPIPYVARALHQAPKLPGSRRGFPVLSWSSGPVRCRTPPAGRSGGRRAGEARLALCE